MSDLPKSTFCNGQDTKFGIEYTGELDGSSIKGYVTKDGKLKLNVQGIDDVKFYNPREDKKGGTYYTVRVTDNAPMYFARTGESKHGPYLRFSPAPERQGASQGAESAGRPTTYGTRA